MAHFDEDGEQHYYSHPKKSAELTEEILTRLRFDNETKEKVLTLVRMHDTPIMIDEVNAPSKKRLKRILSQIGVDLTYDLIEIKRCDNSSQNPQYYRGDDFYKETYNMLDEIINGDECFTIKDLKINGNDLIAIGFKGKDIGKALQKCLDGVIAEKVANNKNELLKYIASAT